MKLSKRMRVKHGYTAFIETFLGKKDLVGVMVGYLGIRAEHILKHLNMNMLYIVDPFKMYPELEDWRTVDLKKWEQHLKDNFGNNEHVSHLPVTSRSASYMFEKHSVDFVYIDGCHLYEEVKNDVHDWYEKVKPYGSMWGHDIILEDVATAVKEFARNNGLKVYAFDGDWTLRKE